MNVNNAILAALGTLLLISGEGCTKSDSGQPASKPSPAQVASADTVARVHWLGERRLGLEAGAYYVMRLWQLPETGKLEGQTLDNLATAPWRLLHGEQEATNVLSNALGPLLADIVQQECYFEVHQPTNRAGEWVFAIRLDKPQVERWETYSAAVVQSLMGVFAVPDHRRRGWSIKNPAAPHLIELSRVGEWTLLGAADERNALLGTLVARIRSSGVPYLEPRDTHDWIEADFDLARSVKALGLGWSGPRNFPKVSLSIAGDGGNVLTHGELTFPEPLQIEPEPWNVPTNRIVGPICSFTALRGFKPWLASWKTWNDLRLGPPPNQLCFWAPQGVPLQIIASVPLEAPSNTVHAVEELLLQKANPWLASYGRGTFEPLVGAEGAIWMGLPLISPFIKTSIQSEVALCGLLTTASSGTNTQQDLLDQPSLGDLLKQMSQTTNLVCFDWEMTEPRIESCLYIGQALRAALRRSPLPFQSIAAAWLYAVKQRLGNCTTTITRADANRLVFDRKSSIGLTGAELNLLADWLESPQFPRGLYSLLTPAEEQQPSAIHPQQ